MCCFLPRVMGSYPSQIHGYRNENESQYNAKIIFPLFYQFCIEYNEAIVINLLINVSFIL